MPIILQLTSKRLMAVLLAAIVIVAFFASHSHKPQNQAKFDQEAPAVHPSNRAATPNQNVPGADNNKSVLDAGPKVPSGSFVSTYKASPNSRITSSCTTTAGATCQIRFTKDGVTKYLPVQTVSDSDKFDVAGTSWSWTPESIGLGFGQWQVSAVARLNSQIKSNTVSTLMEIDQ